MTRKSPGNQESASGTEGFNVFVVAVVVWLVGFFGSHLHFLIIDSSTFCQKLSGPV